MFYTHGCRPLLTGCILKQVKILHEKALFSHKIFKNSLGRRHSLLHRLYSHPSAPYSKFPDPPLVIDE